MPDHPTGGDEPDVPIPPPSARQALMFSAVGGFLGAAAGVIVVIWLLGCGC